MQKGKSIIWIIVVAVLTTCLFLVPGCQTGVDSLDTQVSSGETQITSAQEKVSEKSSFGEIKVIRFVTDETDPPTVEAFNKAIKEYEELNPDVKIQLELVSGDNLIPYYATNVVGGNAPDIGKTFESLTVEYINNGYALPVDQIIEGLGGEDAFFEGSLMKWKDGHYYNVPYAGGGPVLYLRKDLLEQSNLSIPTDWNEWLEVADKLTIDENNDGTIDVYGTCIAAGKTRMTEHCLEVLAWQSGKTMFDADLNPTFNNEGVVNALKFMKELSKFCPPGIGEYSFYEMIDAYACLLYTSRCV